MLVFASLSSCANYRYGYESSIPPAAQSAYIRSQLCREQEDWQCALAYLDRSIRLGGASARLARERIEILEKLEDEKNALHF